jgi:hypothetical protein
MVAAAGLDHEAIRAEEQFTRRIERLISAHVLPLQ